MLLPLLLATVASGPCWAEPDPLSTTAERSGFQETGRYDEVLRLCRGFAERWPQAVSVETFGKTPEGRLMVAMVVNRTKARSPADAKLSDIPVLLLQGGIHAGEIDGKDAGFLALRQMLENDDPALARIIIVFVPVFNVDGHERFGTWNRPNQVGPKAMGWRVTSQNLNLNRDYAKADAPEMVAMLKLLKEWDPILYVDLHVTDGAQFQPDVAILVEPNFVGAENLIPLGKTLQKDTMDRLRDKGSMPLPFYPSFVDYSDPDSGFSDSAYTPKFSTGYWPLRNRLAMLVETHSWKDYPTRVRTTLNTIHALVEIMARDGRSWLEAADQADREAMSLAGSPVALSFRTTEKPGTLDFPGYAYQKSTSEISGGKALSYDTSTPKVWTIPFYSEVVPDKVVPAPGGGYLVPVGQADWVAERLSRHGIQFHRLQHGLDGVPVQTFRATDVVFGKKPSEGHMTAKVVGEWRPEAQSLAPGSLFVPIAQPEARLIMALLEPQAPDSYASWGFFNASFEQKEYMEDYVLEEVAREMLATRPEVKAAFERRLASDPEFAKDPAARLDFFYRLHPSYDDRYMLYPVLRTDKTF